MKAITTITILLALVTLTQASCLATSYCTTCSSSVCGSCPAASTFYKGAMILASGVCSARTTAQKVPVNASQVLAYVPSLTSGFGTTIDPVICKSGYYAFNDSVTATQHGCYATSTLSSTPLSGITANTPTSLTNCEYITSKYTANDKYWTCIRCNSGYTLSNSGLSNASCASSVSITNCSRGKVESSTTKCAECNTGYVAANNELSCVAVTTATANCVKLDSTGLLCDTCDASSYFSGTACVKAAFLKIIAGSLLALMVYLQ